MTALPPAVSASDSPRVPVHLRCVRCWSLVAPSEASCAGCGRSFTPAEIAAAIKGAG